MAKAGLDGDDLYGALVRYLAQAHGVQVRTVRVADERKAMRRFDPARRVLHISEHTAANHVRSILMKTGMANRTAAAHYARRRGLLGQELEDSGE